ncbi:hypothetical protein N658DRAFT_509524 [Parathielavia hyrcaniae]|uniref:CFEM domain-containing protein n=1 Tax=Parathielavia hyrcaniae TaxID=113614 RepID=A0AAN6PVH6_9PEZI|nr:hypothetical protein N658DRAFT_509524 [Parathielavia hyrcaniae]
MRSAVNTCSILGLCLLPLGHASDAAGSISAEEGYAALPDCAQTCFVEVIGQSTCSLTGATCLCNDDQFNNVATSCITSNCTVKESLTAKNLTSRMCGLPVEGDSSLIPLYSIFLGLAGLAMILRIAARVVTRAYFWWDDFANLFGFIGSSIFTGFNIKAISLGQSLDIWFVPFDNITSVLRVSSTGPAQPSHLKNHLPSGTDIQMCHTLQIFYAEMLLYTITRFFVRASIILFYMRVFPATGHSKLGRVVQYTMVFNVVYNLGFLFAVIFQCRPVSHFWTSWEGADAHDSSGAGYCGDANILAWVAAATGIAYDIWLLALPFSQLLALDLHWKKKLMGGAMFFVGVAVIIISLIRLKTINEFTRAVNPTKDIVQVSLWSGLELDVGVICPCLPSFRLLLRRLLPRVLGSSERYELGPVFKSNPTAVVAGGAGPSGMRRSSGFNGSKRGGGQSGSGGESGECGAAAEIWAGKGQGTMMGNTVVVGYGSGGSNDGGSFESVKGLVEVGRAR